MSNSELTKQTSNSDEDIIDLSQYIKTLWFNKWRIGFLALGVTVLVAVWVMQITPEYRATATLLIETEQAKAVSIEEVYGLDGSKKEYLTTQFEILKSDNLAQQVIDELELAKVLEFNSELIEKEPSLIESAKSFVKGIVDNESSAESKNKEMSAYVRQQEILELFKERLSIEPVRSTQLVKISFESQEPELAAKVANALGNAYINSHMSAKMAMTNSAMNWLQERSENVARDLQAAELELQAFRNSEQIVDLEDGVQSMNSSTIKNLNERFLATRSKRIELENAIKQLNNLETGEMKALRDLNVLNSSPVIQNLRQAELAAETKLTELDQTYGPKHPKMIAANAELKQIRDKLDSQLQLEVNELDSQLRALRESERQIQAELNQAEGQFLSASEKEAQYRKLKANVERLTELNDLIVTRFKEMDITSDFNSANARFTDEAQPPIIPVKPKKSLIVGLAMVLSIFVGCGLVLLLAALNNTFTNSDEVEEELHLRFLGLVPKIKLKRGQNLPLHTYFDKKQKQFTECIRTLRTSFMLNYINTPRTTTLVTSSIPGEGKSTTAVNLAFSLSQMNKVLLIDADLRRPSLAKRFGLPGYQPGLSNFLTGSNDFAECIHHDAESGIDLMPAGQFTHNSLELLSSKRFNTLLEQLKNKYERIIIDSAPCQVVSDALVLSKIADNTLFVVKSDATKKDLVKNAVSRLTEAGAKIDGVILNRVDVNSKTSQYYGYYDYYGYSDDTAADVAKAS
ncbi:polysaccharide biosynthesis tyrosine autokinase [Pseudoalteromonas sp.]|uniref:GumC family protein n=1 Tax=Pseudoalteromonas sp. TaxID=53249 RepID=UPI002608FC17|nr:polysaccharide biosynthesis tyrosine autokinase [Pseudoalteromonas sp.]MCP4058028.1 polysaccharide biosynthesis tyrosine autokinase [Pseudoalteromonas sp.]MCP4585089.1 polysaccharide biosynthesis tyrosine autokinase [Pseudoalteromonas sp.]